MAAVRYADQGTTRRRHRPAARPADLAHPVLPRLPEVPVEPPAHHLRRRCPICRTCPAASRLPLVLDRAGPVAAAVDKVAAAVDKVAAASAVAVVAADGAIAATKAAPGVPRNL